MSAINVLPPLVRTTETVILHAIVVQNLIELIFIDQKLSMDSASK